jgi:hypothetical protein
MMAGKKKKPVTKRAAGGGFVGRGSTADEARIALDEKIEAALTGPYFPVVIAFRGEVHMVYRDPHAGWVATIIAEPETPSMETTPILGFKPRGTFFKDRDEAVKFTLLHVAQLTWRAEDGESSPVFVHPLASTAQTGGGIIEIFAGWARWQLEYRRVLAQLLKNLTSDAGREQAPELAGRVVSGSITIDEALRQINAA